MVTIFKNFNEVVEHKTIPTSEIEKRIIAFINSNRLTLIFMSNIEKDIAKK